MASITVPPTPIHLHAKSGCLVVLATYVMFATAGRAVGELVAVLIIGVAVNVWVTVGVISWETEVQVGALVRVAEGWMVRVGVHVGGCRMMVAVGVGDS